MNLRYPYLACSATPSFPLASVFSKHRHTQTVFLSVSRMHHKILFYSPSYSRISMASTANYSSVSCMQRHIQFVYFIRVPHPAEHPVSYCIRIHNSNAVRGPMLLLFPYLACIVTSRVYILYFNHTLYAKQHPVNLFHLYPACSITACVYSPSESQLQNGITCRLTSLV